MSNKNEGVAGFEDQMSNDDYGFVFGDDGELKAVYLPSTAVEIPKLVKQVFKLCGIKNPDKVKIHTIH